MIRRANGTYWLIWSSSDNPPKARTAHWTHDIYYSLINPSNPSIKPKKIISRPEAQEPASAAISRDGHIMIACEDGWNVKNRVGQRWGLYDGNLRPVKPYPNLVRDGGNSGHVAAVDNIFVLCWCDGWDNSVPGADGIGVGKNIKLSTFSSSGTPLASFDVQASDNTRDWWPIVAGSASRAVVLWQRYVEGRTYADLMYAVFDPLRNRFIKHTTSLASRVKYYTYDVQYYPTINRFMVVGSYYGAGGFAYLLNDRGEIVARNLSLLPIVRESKPAKKNYTNYSLAVYPRSPRGAFVLRLTRGSIRLNHTIPDDYNWQGMGTAGIFTGPRSAYFASLSSSGIIQKKFAIKTDKLP